MAFEATHIRFARDLAPLLRVQNFPAYFAGAVYPDSRYMTGIGRDQTHGHRRLTPEATDFEKGWFTHLLYDELVGPCYLRTSVWANQPVSAGSEAWISMTAAKLVEDRQTCASISVEELFVSMEPPVLAPRGEDPHVLQEYYRLLQRLYQELPSVERYRSLFSAFRLSEPLADTLSSRAHEFSNDVAKCSEIATFYAPAVQRGRERLQQAIPETYSD